jgi:hypothetical protein
MKQTRQPVHAIKQSNYLDVYDSYLFQQNKAFSADVHGKADTNLKKDSDNLPR